MREYILADNQDISRAGLFYLLDRLKDTDIITEIANKAELIKKIESKPESVVIIDYTLFDFTGSDELLIIKERFPGVSWLLFSDELSEDFLRRILLSSEAFSVVMKDSSKEEILFALQSVSRNERFICNHVGNMLLNSGSVILVKDILLTSTEKEILKEIALGKTTKEIARERNLSFHTVNSHRKNIFRKLDVNNLHEATKYAMRAGIVDLAEYYI